MKSLLILLLATNAWASPEAIYGVDNRQDLYEVSNTFYKNLAASTAALIEKGNIRNSGTHSTITARSLGEMYKLCPEERFRQQPTAATCSGTLIAPDIVMTAGHCYDLPKQTCKDYVWVFDYKVNRENQASVTVSNENIYECEKVLLNEWDDKLGVDHALIKLKRVVSDRPYARLRLKGQIKVNTPLVLIGHPRGLPTKIAADAYVLKTEKTSFTSNVDAFSVNSGSGVFNGQTGEVEGILSSGRADFDSKGNCSTSKIYEMSEGNEEVMKIDKVRDYLKR